MEVVGKRLTDEGFSVDWGRTDDDDQIDGLLTATWHGQEHHFPVVVRSNLTPGAVALLPAVTGGVVLTGEATPRVRQALTGAGWGYADGAGRVSLSAPGLVVRLDAMRSAWETPSIDRTFSKTGLPLTYVETPPATGIRALPRKAWRQSMTMGRRVLRGVWNRAVRRRGR